ncbi:MAG: ABC transporter permease [Chloroflexi bacterium]|nr:ABC transporter permease [Chloroflexota bacterium]
MNFSENFRIALRALTANKMRSALTMLGIIIGVGAVVALMAIGNGATASITGEVQGIGSNLLTIMPGVREAGPQAQTTTAFMYYSDYEVLAANLKNVDYVVPTFQGRATVTQNKESVSVNVNATTPDFAPARAYEVAYGRFLTEADRNSAARAAVLGSQTATDLFGSLNPVGRTIKIDGVIFKVVGVLESKGASGFINEDEIIMVPLETGYEKLFGSTAAVNGKLRLSTVTISASSPEAISDVTVQAERLLRREHRLKPADALDFSILSQSSILSTLTAITTTLTVFLGAIAGISLLVGGIGIMNIMLVSVTERTREIGLRKAVGAKRSVILLQFLVETLVLSLLGGVLGIGLGWGIAALVEAANLIAATVTLDSVLMAFSFSAAVGIFFGLYPAYRASRLRPIEALRYE